MRAPRVCGAAGKKKIPEIQGTGGNPGKTGSGTHLLPWGCHTIMELVLAALPVETTGALLRTGATAEIAAILIVGVECGKEWRNGGGDRSFIPLRSKPEALLVTAANTSRGTKTICQSEGQISS
jgi:hypothetical protein